jgi:hypothetical protein
VRSLDDQLYDEQVAAGAEGIATVLRRLVALDPNVKVTQFKKEMLHKMARECISCYIIRRSEHAKEYGSRLFDDPTYTLPG